MYILFTCWERIRDTGQYQHTPYHKLSNAVVEFNKIFRAKTGNYWSSVKRCLTLFEPHSEKTCLGVFLGGGCTATE